MALIIFYSSCEILILDRGAIEADIYTVFVYQCRVKVKIVTKKPKAQSIFQKSSNFYPYQGSGTTNAVN